jgi:hypothetical protein
VNENDLKPGLPGAVNSTAIYRRVLIRDRTLVQFNVQSIRRDGAGVITPGRICILNIKLAKNLEGK